jgi:hypothetical protein
LVAGLSLLVGCGDDGTSGTGGEGAGSDGGGKTTGSGGGGGDGGGGTNETCTTPTPVPCEDDVILTMNLQDDITNGMIVNTPEGTGFHSAVDATAGGPFATDPESYTFAKFTTTGLEKVSISDEDALTSMDWDISIRRNIIRLNSGHSGPSCVTGARVPGTATYDEVTTVPPDLTFRKDLYFTETCEFIPDGSGLESSPATVLSGYYEYQSCVEMTGNVYVIGLADGRLLKFTVTHYYNEAVQQQCNDTGTIPMMNTGSGEMQVRWSFF